MDPTTRREPPLPTIPPLPGSLSMDDYAPHPDVLAFKANVERISKVSSETLQSRFDV